MTSTRRRNPVRDALLLGVALVLMAACAAPALAGVAAPPVGSPAAADPASPRVRRAERGGPGDTKRACAYSYHRIDQLETLGQTVGRTFDCALVYNGPPDWATWEQPWFVIHNSANLNWARWKTAVPGRRLIITQPLIPSMDLADWRTRGAAGEFELHARALATNLVAAGLGDSVIRLSHESNGTWNIDGIGNDPAYYASWKEFWARTVRAMRSVPGASFEFDWTVNAGYRPIAFNSYYPGDDVVDVIGADVYDFWAGPGPAPADPRARWQAQYTQPGGLRDLVTFARRHGKPLSIPEWGLSAVDHKGGIGDNPNFVDAIAAVVRTNVTAYHSYFNSPTDVGMLLGDAPRAVAAYQRHFGTNGDSVR